MRITGKDGISGRPARAKGHIELALIAGGVLLGILIIAQTLQASLASI